MVYDASNLMKGLYMNITEYKIVSDPSPAGLTQSVNDLVQDGWVPTGGVTVVQSPAVERIGEDIRVQSFSFQAMVKKA